jgi:hypothetical protein
MKQELLTLKDLLTSSQYLVKLELQDLLTSSQYLVKLELLYPSGSPDFTTVSLMKL